MTSVLKGNKMPLSGLGQLEKRTFRLHFSYSLLEGICLGVLALNEFIFLRSIHGSNIAVGLLFQFSVFVLIFSVAINQVVKRVLKMGRFMVITGIITRLPLFFMLLFPENLKEHPQASVYHSVFLAAFLFFYSSNPVVYPVINRLLKTNYTAARFGRLFSYSTTANKIIMLGVTFLAGLWLDADPSSYRIMFPVIAVLGILSFFLLAQVPFSDNPAIIENNGWWQSVKNSFSNMKNILRNNRAFRDFEVAFMYYGFAFMGTVSVITIFFEKELALSYTSMAFYKNSYNILAILLLPFFGKMIGKTDPRIFSALTFGSLLFYLLFIMLTTWIPLMTSWGNVQIYLTLMLAMVFNGIFAATMSLLWSIGSSYFCKREESADYQAIHLSFTGLRSFFAPVLGVVFYEWFGFTVSFLIGIALLLISIILSLRSGKRVKL